MPSPETLRRALLLFLVGALIGPVLDQIHVLGGALHYPAPDLFGQPWWVIPQFGFAAVAMVVPCEPFLAAGGVADRRATMRELALPLAWFVGAYLASVVFAGHPLVLGVVLLAFFAARVRHDGGLRVALYALGCAAGGTLWEATISTAGLFQYDVPHGLGPVPFWLPGLYLHAALCTRHVARLFLPAESEVASIAGES